MSYTLWIMAFLGIAVIYFGEKVVKLITKEDVNTNLAFAMKIIGTLISAIAMFLLYNSGMLS